MLHSHIITTNQRSSYSSSEEPRNTGDLDLSYAVRRIHRQGDRVHDALIRGRQYFTVLSRVEIRRGSCIRCIHPSRDDNRMGLL
jgi:hypothetical protein